MHWHFRCANPKSALEAKIRDLDESELDELELATGEALGRVEPKEPLTSVDQL